MINKTLLLIYTLLLIDTLYAQDSALIITEEKKNSLYFELGGNGGSYSLNYERIIIREKVIRISARVGASYVLLRTAIVGADSYLFPITLSGITGARKNLFEIGIGNTVVINNIGKVKHRITGIVGYRRYMLDERFLLRAGFTPFLEINKGKSSFSPWGGLSLGYVF